MATLPDAQSLGERPAPRPSSGVASYSPVSSAATGQLIQGAGAELAQGGNELQQANTKYDALAAEDAYNQLQTQAATLKLDPNKGFVNVQGKGAIGADFYNDYTNQFQEASKSVSDALSNDQQKQMFQQRAAIAANQYRSDLLSHQAMQTEKFASNTEDNTIQVELRNMGANPGNQQIFDSGMARINATIDGKVGRLGLPPAQSEEMKGQVLDAAWSTRILTTLNHDPYAAEKMFQGIQQQLGPVAQVKLDDDVTKSVKALQVASMGDAYTFKGKALPDPARLMPAINGVSPLQGIVTKMESGGKRYDEEGNLLTSSKGALGENQVMPFTAKDPGYGVKPAQDDSPEELARVGRDYLGAMVARYQDPTLVLAAYNAGPGMVDDWINGTNFSKKNPGGLKLGDPRTGQISAADWIAKIPFSETKKYVTKGIGMLGDQQQASSAAPDVPLTPHQMAARLPIMQNGARAAGLKMYPNDPAFAESLVARVTHNASMVIQGAQANQLVAYDNLLAGLNSKKYQSMDDIQADPQAREALNQASPMEVSAIQSRLTKGENQPTPQSTALYYQYLGKYNTDRDAFVKEDLKPLISQLPYQQWHELAGLQMRTINKADMDAEKAVNLQHAMTVASTYALKPIGMSVPTKDTSTTKREKYEQFSGAFSVALDNFQKQNNRPPKDEEIVSIAKNLTTMVQERIPGLLWDDNNEIRAFQVNQDNQGRVSAKNMPSELRNGIVESLTRKSGRPPTEAQIQTAYILILRQPTKVIKPNKQGSQ